MTRFISHHLDLFLLVGAYVIATCAYYIGKGVVDEDLRADVEQLLKQNESQREIIRQLGLSQIRTSGNHPAGTKRHLVSVRSVDNR